MVPRLEAMKSASRPGSVMLMASVCRSSDISGDSETICWKLVLMLRWSASISSLSLSPTTSGISVTRACRYGRDVVISSRRTRVTPWTMMRRLPSGSLNILWMWLAVPIGMQILLLRIVLGGFALGEHGDHPARRHGFVDETDRALARHGERHEGLRKQHGVAQRKHRDFRRHVVPSTDLARRTR